MTSLGGQVIGVEDSGGKADKVTLFRDSLGVQYPLFFDPTRKVARAYDVTRASTTYIVSADFIVREKIETGVSEAYLERMWEMFGHGVIAP